jgi:hypothetical protein
MEMESQKNYQLSLDHWNLGLQYLKKALDKESNPDVQKMLKEKLTEYLSRAELVKTILQNLPLSSSNLSQSGQHNISKSQPSSTYPSNEPNNLILKEMLNKAVTIAEAAEDEDESGSYVTAIEKYSSVITLFSEAMKLGNTDTISILLILQIPLLA